jgi:hypothetical protein
MDAGSEFSQSSLEARFGAQQRLHAPDAIRADNCDVRHSRHYTIQDASDELPWVVEELAVLREARESLTDEDVRSALAAGTPGNGGGSAGKQLGEAFNRLQSGIAEFQEREIVLRDLDRGLVDFPAIREGREVYLCWVEGEDQIAFWHELDAGYAGRQEL